MPRWYLLSTKETAGEGSLGKAAGIWAEVVSEESWVSMQPGRCIIVADTSGEPEAVDVDNRMLCL